MTDMQQYVEMLNRANIPFEIRPRGDNQCIDVERGYSFFYTSHEFDVNGKLVDVGAYE